MVNPEKLYTRAQVEEYNKDDNLWIVIDNNVYDVTQFLSEHPGGEEALLEFAGKDGTEAFDEVGHSVEAKELMKKFKIGEIVESERVCKKCPKVKSQFKGVIKTAVNRPILSLSVVIGVVAVGSFLAYRIIKS